MKDVVRRVIRATVSRQRIQTTAVVIQAVIAALTLVILAISVFLSSQVFHFSKELQEAQLNLAELEQAERETLYNGTLEYTVVTRVENYGAGTAEDVSVRYFRFNFLPKKEPPEVQQGTYDVPNEISPGTNFPIYTIIPTSNLATHLEPWEYQVVGIVLVIDYRDKVTQEQKSNTVWLEYMTEMNHPSHMTGDHYKQARNILCGRFVEC